MGKRRATAEEFEAQLKVALGQDGISSAARVRMAAATIFAARYLTDEAYRRRITCLLNKGENLRGQGGPWDRLRHESRSTVVRGYPGDLE